MPDLKIKAFEVENYRLFKHLTIERCGSVNLIVGKNNVGKSSLLEALFLYLNPLDQEKITPIYSSRDEGMVIDPAYKQNRNKYVHLLNNKISEPSACIKLSDPNTAHQVQFEFNNQILSSISVDNYQLDVYPEFILHDKGKYFQTLTGNIESNFVYSNNIRTKNLEIGWDSIAFTEKEDIVLECLQLMNKQIERISFIIAEEYSDERIPVVKLKGERRRISLNSMGEGMLKLFRLSVALMNTENGVLLIDEIENGIHHSIHGELWDFIYEVSKKLNIQLFATSHSYDCIEGFHYASKNHADIEPLVIRLREYNNTIKADLFSTEELNVLLFDKMEFR